MKKAVFPVAHDVFPKLPEPCGQREVLYLLQAAGAGGHAGEIYALYLLIFYVQSIQGILIKPPQGPGQNGGIPG